MARARQSGRRTDYTWQGDSGWFATAVAAAGSLGNTAIVTFNEPGTIVRIRGSGLAQLDQGGADGAAVYAMGLMVVSDDQNTAGVTAIPSPLEDKDGDWIWHRSGVLRTITGTDSDTYGSQVDRFEVDSKAMRRVKQNDVLAMVVDMANFTGTNTVDAAASFRVLFGT